MPRIFIRFIIFRIGIALCNTSRFIRLPFRFDMQTSPAPVNAFNGLWDTCHVVLNSYELQSQTSPTERQRETAKKMIENVKKLATVPTEPTYTYNFGDVSVSLIDFDSEPMFHAEHGFDRMIGVLIWKFVSYEGPVAAVNFFRVRTHLTDFEVIQYIERRTKFSYKNYDVRKKIAKRGSAVVYSVEFNKMRRPHEKRLGDDATFLEVYSSGTKPDEEEYRNDYQHLIKYCLARNMIGF